MRTKGKNINILGTPTKVEDMKDGEMRVDIDSTYGRVGNQVLKKDWLRLLAFDDFEDNDFDTWIWNNTSDGNNGGTITETGGQLLFTLGDASAGTAVKYAHQDGIEQMGPGGGGTWEFDVWGLCIIPDNLDVPSTGDIVEGRAEFYWSGNGTDWVEFLLKWDGTQYGLSVAYGDGTSTSSTHTSIAPGVDAGKFWWRIAFTPGVDTYVRLYYGHQVDPFMVGWTEISLSKAFPAPTGHTALEFKIGGRNSDASDPALIKHEFVADWRPYAVDTITRDSEGGFLWMGQETTWALARDSVTAEFQTLMSAPTSTLANAAHNVSKAVHDYTVGRSFKRFDLSSIPADAIVLGAFVQFYTNAGGSPPITVVVQESAYGPTFELADFDDIIGAILGQHLISTSGPAFEEITLNAAGVAYLQSKIGTMVEFCFRDYDYDYLDIEPADDVSNNISVDFDTAPQTKLTVTYRVSAPIV